MGKTGAKEPEPKVKIRSLLGELRKRRGLSQRTLAEKCGISRGRLRKLEGASFEDATFGELKRISQVLQIELTEMVRGDDGWPHGVYFHRAGESTVHLDAAKEGYKIISLLPPRRDLFAGKLVVAAKRFLAPPQVPQAKTVFLQGLLGNLRLVIAEESYELQEGDSLLFQGDRPYTIENPLVRDSVAFLITVPAFAPPA